MKKILSIAILLASFIPAMAQSSQVKKAAKSMFKLTTFNAEGKLLNTSYGAFVGSDGTALSTWNAFVGASSANVIDAQGRKYDVDCLIGANEIYDVSKFRVIVPAEKKMQITPLTVTSTPVASGGECWFVEYDVKNPVIKRYSPTNVENFSEQSLPYYTFEQTAADELAGSPFLNSNGELIGLMQPSTKRTDIYCPSSQYAMSMTVNALTANQATIRQTNMRVALPTDYNQAVLALMMSHSRNNNANLLATANEFISLFPTAYDGYQSKAEVLANSGDFAGANSVMMEAIEKSEKKDEAHFAFSRIIYNKVLLSNDSTYTEWTLDKAIEEINAALAISPLPTYDLHKSRILYSQKKYEEAYSGFIAATKTNMRSAECFQNAALCQQELNAPQEKIVELLDSAVACFQEPYKMDAAPYILARAMYLDEIGKSRKAVTDLFTYEKIMQNFLNANFYYMREQTELRCRLYQQAIDDIEKACQMDPRNETYLAEKAMLFVRVNKLDEGLATAQQCINRFPEYGDAHAILGLALIQKGKKKDGIAALEKAQELNSQMAPQLLEKYKK